MSGQQRSDQQTLFSSRLSYYEENLITNPFCVFSTQDLKKLLLPVDEDDSNTLVVGDTNTKRVMLVYRYKDPYTGSSVVWKLKPDSERGNPGPVDQDVIALIQRLALESNLQNPLVLPSWRSMAKQIGRTTASGRYATLVRESVQRIAATVIETNIFYIKDESGKRVKAPFLNPSVQQNVSYPFDDEHYIFTLWTYCEKGVSLPDGSRAETACVWLNSPWRESLRSFYARPIDFEYFVNLPPLAKRIYLLQGRKFYGLRDSEYSVESYDEWCRQLPVSRQHYFSKAQQVFQRAHTSLIETGFLADVEWIGSKKLKPWAIRYYPGERAKSEISEGKARATRRAKAIQQPFDATQIGRWVAFLSERLEDAQEQNKGYYIKLENLILRNLLRSSVIEQAVGLAREDRELGNLRTTLSQSFTDHLKRLLWPESSKEDRNSKFKDLLGKV